jgi:hypothetical protein
VPNNIPDLDPVRDHWLVVMKGFQPIILGLVTVIASIGGAYMSTEYRIQAIEKTLDNRKVIVDAYPEMQMKIRTQTITQENQSRIQSELAHSLNATTAKLQIAVERLAGVAARMDEQSRMRYGGK